MENKYKSFLIFILLACTINAQDKSEITDITIELDTLQVSSSLTEQSFKIDPVFADSFYKESIKIIPSRVNSYELPYSFMDNYPNYKRLGLNTAVLYGAGFVTLGILQVLPEDATAWNKKDIVDVPPFKRWWRNVKAGPVVDKDNHFFNYVLHPYAGAAYYMGARSIGFNAIYSLLYAAGISTFFWEYGIEAFMEIPSIQDLIITPLAGIIFGEGFYVLKRHIVSNGYRLFGSQVLGNVIAYIIDPINEVIGIFAGNPNRVKKASDPSLVCMPWLKSSQDGAVYGFSVSISF